VGVFVYCPIKVGVYYFFIFIVMKRTLVLIILGFLLTSCGSTYQLSTLNHDPVYIDGVRVDVIENEIQLDRKLRTDSDFRWDFSRYASTQSLRWHYDFYYDNRMWRSPFRSPFDFYWNSNDFWWHWGSNNYFMSNHWNRFGLYGYNRWSPFGYDRWGYNNSWGWNGYNGYGFNDWGWRNRMNDYAWKNRDRTNTAYVVGRRGSNNVITNSNRTNIENRIIVNRNKPRLIINKDEVIDNAIIKLKRNNNNIRVYENPNNVPNKIIIRNNNNTNNNVRNYNRPPNNNNNINRSNINNNRPSRNYNVPRTNNNIRSTPPPTRVSPPVRSNISRGGSNTGRSSSSVIRGKNE